MVDQHIEILCLFILGDELQVVRFKLQPCQITGLTLKYKKKVGIVWMVNRVGWLNEYFGVSRRRIVFRRKLPLCRCKVANLNYGQDLYLNSYM